MNTAIWIISIATFTAGLVLGHWLGRAESRARRSVRADLSAVNGNRWRN